MAALEATDLSFFLLADVSDRNLRLLTASLILVAVLLVAAVLLALVSRWRRQRDTQEDSSPTAQLAQFRSLYEAGTVGQEEFERLRALLNEQMRLNLGIPMTSKAKPTHEGIQLPPDASAQAPPPPNGQPPDEPSTGIRPA